MYYVYMLRMSDNSLYTGITTDVERRFNEHKNKTPKGAKYTRSKEVASIESVWQCADKVKASKLEYHIKKLKKSDKEMLIKEKTVFSTHFSDKLNRDDYKRLEDVPRGDGL